MADANTENRLGLWSQILAGLNSAITNNVAPALGRTAAAAAQPVTSPTPAGGGAGFDPAAALRSFLIQLNSKTIPEPQGGLLEALTPTMFWDKLPGRNSTPTPPAATGPTPELPAGPTRFPSTKTVGTEFPSLSLNQPALPSPPTLDQPPQLGTTTPLDFSTMDKWLAQGNPASNHLTA